MNDIYTAPSSTLAEPETGSEFGSVENGINGNYTLTYSGAMSEAWHRLKGAKANYWLAFLLYIVCVAIVQVIVGAVITPLLGDIFGGIVGQVLMTFVAAPIGVGLAILGLRRMAGESMRSTSVFDHFDKAVPLLLCTLLMYLLIFIGMLLLVLPGIYLAVAYLFAPTLMVEKNMGIWEAMETSRKAVTHKWFTIFSLFLSMGIIVMLSVVLLLVGVVWTVPLSMLLLSKIYLTLFGVEKTTLQRA